MNGISYQQIFDSLVPLNPLAHGRISRPVTHIENGNDSSIIHIAIPLNFVEHFFSF